MKKVLIVEDSVFIARAIQVVLKSEGIDVLYTSKGAEVVGLIKTNAIDCVVLDLMMPGMSGKEVLQAIRSTPGVENTPVIILTAKTDALKWDEELKSCDTFMSKPFENEELVKNIKELLEK